MTPLFRPLLLLAAIALATAGCTTLSADRARSDAGRILDLSHAEDRFRVLLRDLSRQQAGQDAETKPLLGAIDRFWQEQALWETVRGPLVDEYLQAYSPAELQAIRAALDGPAGEHIAAHGRTLDDRLAQRAAFLARERMPLLLQQLQAMQNALVTGADGALTPRQDFAATRERAAAGDAAAQLLLAEMYLAGSGTPRNPRLALQWLEKSAARDHAPALDTLASFHYRGVIVPRNYRRARELFEQAAAHQYLPAVNNLAWLLSTCPDDSLRDGARAIALLGPVMDRSVQMMDTYAAAHAEAGQYAEAVAWQRQAVAGIGSTADPRMPATLDRLQSYAAGKPWRDPPVPVFTPTVPARE
ncbi:MAG: tetratricopeptide repeat protein [Pseudomonadota bacterium]